ncbi:hypothetical protein HK102_009010 [Quaeritorhiza haematococci]|nr:hypothetical protein HK102_009010 [Quaeritorhiza haematococci]
MAGRNAEEETVKLRQGPIERFSFDVFHSAFTGVDIPDTIASILLIITDFQLLVFSLYPALNIKNVPPILKYIIDFATIFEDTSSSSYPLNTNSANSAIVPSRLVPQLVLWGISVGLVIFALACAIYLGLSFRRGRFQKMTRVSIGMLRVVTKLLISVLAIPVMQLLMMNLECDYNEDRLRRVPDAACLSDFNLPLFIVSIVILVVFIPYSIMASSVYFPIDPASKSREARAPIALYDPLSMLTRAFLVILFALVEQPVVLIVFLLLSLGVLLYVHTVSQPFYHQLFNQLRCGLLLGAFLSSIVAAISIAVDTPYNDKGFFIAWVLVYPMGLVAGFFVANPVKTMICRHVYQQLKLVKERKHRNRAPRPLQRSLEVRPILRTGLKTLGGLELQRECDPSSACVDHKHADIDEQCQLEMDLHDHSEGRTFELLNDINHTAETLAPTESAGTLAVNMAESVAAHRTILKPIFPFLRPSDVEMACRFIRNNCTSEAKTLVNEIFEQGLIQFPKNPMIRILYARYIAAYFDNQPDCAEPVKKSLKIEHGKEAPDDDHGFAKRLGSLGGTDTRVLKRKHEEAEKYTYRAAEWADLFMNQSKSLKPNWVTRFYIEVSERSLELRKRGSTDAGSIDDTQGGYSEYRSMFRKAQRYNLRALTEIREFLNHVRAGRQGHDPATYPSFLERITVAGEAASKVFATLMDRYPKCLAVVHLYAKFATTVKSDPELVKKLTTIAKNLCEKEAHVEADENENGEVDLHNDMSVLNAAMTGVSIEQSGTASHATLHEHQHQTTVPEIENSGPTIELKDEFGRESKVNLQNIDYSSMEALGFPSADGSFQFHDDEPPSSINPSEIRKAFEDDDEQDHQQSLQPYDRHRRPRRPSLVNPKTRWNEKPESKEDSNLSVTHFDCPVQEPLEMSPQAHVVDVLEKATRESEHSDASEKNLRVKIHKRRQMAVLLKREIHKFSIVQLCILAWFMVLIGVAYGLTEYVFGSAGREITGLTTSNRLGRRAVEAATSIQQLHIYSMINNTKDYNKSRSKLNETINFVESSVLPYLRDHMASLTKYERVEIIRPPRTSPSIELWNSYEILGGLTDFSRDMLRENASYFQSTSDYRYHFIIRNIGTIRDFLFNVRDRGEADYVGLMSFGSALLGVGFGVVGLTAVIWTMGIFYPVLIKTQRDQVQFLKAFAMIPRKDLMNMLIDIDEAIEELNEDIAASQNNNEQEHIDMKNLRDRNDLKDKFTTLYKRNYLTAVAILTACVFAMFVISMIRVSTAVSDIVFIDLMARRRPLITDVNYYAQEITLMDSKFWHPGEPEMNMENQLRILTQLHKNGITGNAERKIPSMTAVPQLAKILAVGGNCSRSDSKACDPDKRYPPYKPEIGYTYDLVLQPMDVLTSRFIAEAQMYLETRRALTVEQARKTNITDFLRNPHLLIMRGIMPDIIDGLGKAQDMMYALVLDDNRRTQQQVSVIMGVTFGVVFIAFITVFSRFSRKRMSQASEMVNLLFLIPQVVVDNRPELKRFFETAGLSGLNET